MFSQSTEQQQSRQNEVQDFIRKTMLYFSTHERDQISRALQAPIAVIQRLPPPPLPIVTTTAVINEPPIAIAASTALPQVAQRRQNVFESPRTDVFKRHDHRRQSRKKGMTPYTRQENTRLSASSTKIAATPEESSKEVGEPSRKRKAGPEDHGVCAQLTTKAPEASILNVEEFCYIGNLQQVEAAAQAASEKVIHSHHDNIQPRPLEVATDAPQFRPALSAPPILDTPSTNGRVFGAVAMANTRFQSFYSTSLSIRHNLYGHPVNEAATSAISIASESFQVKCSRFGGFRDSCMMLPPDDDVGMEID
ncbi:hypothetical protein BDR26DRAFT_1010688 [Obelidium mucronatum]|nr:hypothetical protein BDR26DRAFT_1010688 [Obelidium mucronatum]